MIGDLMTENKNTFFMLSLPLEATQKSDEYLDSLSDSIDVICASMHVRNVLYKIRAKDHLICLFKSENRKRRGQLNRFCARLLPEDQTFISEGITKLEFETRLERLKQKKATILQQPSQFENYDGEDIRFLDDRSKWYPWQEEIYSMLFDSNGRVKEPHPRKIFSIIDEKGNSGKSTFFKWLTFKNSEKIGRLGYATASQLRASVPKIGAKSIFLVDLARAKSKEDSEFDLLSVIEQVKDGTISGFMYGNPLNFLFKPPHVLITSNYKFQYELLSEDRWECFEITEDKKLKRLEAPKPLVGAKKSGRKPVKK